MKRLRNILIGIDDCNVSYYRKVYEDDSHLLSLKSMPDLQATVLGPYYYYRAIELKFDVTAGMGIKKGVTVITGGGYSGKSTLLEATAAGVYNHIPKDGREYVITDDSAAKISAEDGRSIQKIDLSPFIKWIPSSDVNSFSTDLQVAVPLKPQILWKP